MKNIAFITILTALLFGKSALAQGGGQKTLDNQVNLVFGLSQLASDGFNIEGNVFYKRLVFDYSHGVSLNFGNNMLPDGMDKDQGLALHVPWTTGFGIGYRFNEWLNLRAEPKWHGYEVFFDGDEQVEENLLGEYSIFTLGLGLYGNIRPWKNKDNFLKGIMIAPSLRWWPKVSTNLDNDQFTYTSRISDEMVTYEAGEIGFGGTPFFANISVGYSVRF